MHARRLVRVRIGRTLLLALFLLPGADALATDLARPDAHAPIGVMGDHVHKKGEAMLSYRVMRMRMEGNRDGRTDLSASEVITTGFAVSPTDMDMTMQMWGIMFAPSDLVTLTAMIPWIKLEMDHFTGMGGRFTTRSQGVGDVSFGALMRALEAEHHSAHVGLQVIAPTGSISRKDVTPMSGGVPVQLPYPMQIGSGSWSLAPQLTYNGQTDHWSWGGQVGGTFRLNHNDHDYRLGHGAALTGWLARRFGDWVSTSLRLGYDHWGNIDGADPLLAGALAGMVVPTVDPGRRAGDRLAGMLGANLYVRSGPLKGVRLALEFAVPLVQSLDGPQLETDWNVTAGMQYAF